MVVSPRFLMVALVTALASQTAFAQGGPPLLTDDPGTPGDGKWEINIGFMFEKLLREKLYEAPILDVNYGLGERIQLKYEVPWVILNEKGADAKSGLGNSEFGIKYRFLDETTHSVSMSIYPQFSFNNPTSSDERGLVDSGTEFLLPFQIARHVGPVELGLELGYALKQHEKDEWIYGLAAAWPLTERFELLGEVYGVATTDFEEDTLVFNLGGVHEVHENVNLLFSAGRSFRESSETEPQLLMFFGFQFNF